MKDPLAVLQRIRASRPALKPRPGERCEMCAETVGDRHDHVVDLEQRSLLCTCRGCYLLFTADGAGGSRYRAVPDRYLAFTDFELSAGQWDSLQIPVSVAFFFINSTLDRVAAFYPSPAGATESLLSLDTWEEVVRANPQLATLVPDVEAFLVRTDRADAGAAECFLVPIDACYELVGQLRRLWRGFDGGTEAHDALDSFFAGVRSRARAAPRVRAGTVSSLSFEVMEARPEPYAAVPTLMLRLRITETDGQPVHAVALRCQLMIEPQRRQYGADEEDRLLETFGETPRWGDTLRPFLWTQVGVTVAGFTGSTDIDLPITCTYDFEVAAAKYLHSLSQGEIPVLLLFSGTIFSRGASGFTVEPVAWHEEASYRLPVRTYREVMDLYFPGSGWLRMRRETLDALQQFKASRALTSWDDAIERLLKEAGEDG